MKTILVAVDMSSATPVVVDAARQMTLGHGATLYLVHVEQPDPDFVGYGVGPQYIRDHLAEDFQGDRRTIHELRDSLEKEGVCVHGRVIQGPTIEKIVEEAKRLDADLIVVGQHNRGLLHRLLQGSVTDGVIHKAPCPVLVVPVDAPAGPAVDH